jgi:hypothetical protein
MTFSVRHLIALDETTAAPRDVAARIEAALAREPGAVLVRGAPHERAVLDALPRTLPVVAALPDMARLLRDASEQGLPKAALSRLGRGGVRGLLRLGMTGVRHVGAVARQDFAGLVPVLLALEHGALGRVALRGVVLAAPLTDLLLAAGNEPALAHVLAHARRSLGVPAGLETLNLGHLLARCTAGRLEPDMVLGPVNARGHRMKPSPGAVLEALRAPHPMVLATEVTAGGRIPMEAVRPFARHAGAAGVVVSVTDL